MCGVLKKLDKLPATIAMHGFDYNLRIDKMGDDCYMIQYTDGDDSLFIGPDYVFYGHTLTEALDTITDELKRYKYM